MSDANKLIFCDVATPAMATPVDVITYVSSLEAGGIFAKPVAKSEAAYYARIKKPMDLGTMMRRAKAGHYEPSAAGSPGGGPAALCK